MTDELINRKRKKCLKKNLPSKLVLLPGQNSSSVDSPALP